MVMNCYDIDGLVFYEKEVVKEIVIGGKGMEGVVLK